VARWLVACVVLLAGCRDLKERLTPERDAGVEVEETEEVFPEPPPPQGPAGLKKGRYQIVTVGATVARRNARGTAWDLIGGAAADPEIVVLVGDQPLASCTGAADTPRLICPVGQPITIDGDTVIRLIVEDVDVTGDERIGEAELGDLLAGGRVGVRLKMRAAEQVTSAFVVLARLPDPPSPWARYRAWFLAGGAGAVLLIAGVAVYLARSRGRGGDDGPRVMHGAMPAMPDPAPAGWVCAHCETRNDAVDRTCHHCGARRR
jgi:hypothetical protein